MRVVSSPQPRSHHSPGGTNLRLWPPAWTSSPGRLRWVQWPQEGTATPWATPEPAGPRALVRGAHHTLLRSMAKSPDASLSRAHLDPTWFLPHPWPPRPSDDAQPKGGRAGQLAHLPGQAELLQAASHRAVRQHQLVACLVIVGAQEAGRQAWGQGRQDRPSGHAGQGQRGITRPCGLRPDPLNSSPSSPRGRGGRGCRRARGRLPGPPSPPRAAGMQVLHSVHGAAQPDQGAQHVPGLRAEPWAQSLALLLGGMGALHQPGSGPLSQGDHGRVTRGVDRVWYSTCNRAAGKQRGCVQSCAAPGVGTGACWA